MDKLNLACGGDLSGHEGWLNVDKFRFTDSVIPFDYDSETLLERFGENRFDAVLCKGALIEFSKNPIEVFNDLYLVCAKDALITVILAVVDNSLACFRDPVAKHHYHSEWAQYIGGDRVNGGYGLGLTGKFEIVSNVVVGELQTVVFRVIK